MPARSTILLRALLMLAAVNVAAIHPTNARADFRFHAPEMIALPSGPATPGDLAVGDVDGDGIPEVATFASDKKVHVFQRVAGKWNQVAVSSIGLGATFPNQIPTVRFVNLPAAAPGGGYHDGQFLFNAQIPSAGVAVVSLRLAIGGAWSELVRFGPLPFIQYNAAFSPPVLLPDARSASLQWRIVIPGRDYFDPPMRVYMPRFDDVPPYPQIVHGSDAGGYCTQQQTPTSDPVVGDFNGDGSPELGLVMYNKLMVTPTGNVNTSGANGCWPFTTYLMPTSSPTVNYHAQGIAAGLDGNATTDIVVRDNDGNLRTLFGNVGVAYTFTDVTVSSSVPSPQVATDLVVEDIDNDGDPDLVEAFSSPAGYQVLLNDGSGGFTGTFVPTDDFGGAISSVALADMDGDRKPDLLLAQPGSVPSRVLILPGRGDGSFGVPAGSPLGTLEPTAIATADFDNDGKLDVVIGGHDSDFSDGAQVMQQFRNLVGGVFQDPPNFVTGISVNYYVGVMRMVPFRRDPSDPYAHTGLDALQYQGEGVAPGDEDGNLMYFGYAYSTTSGEMSGLDCADMDGDQFTDRLRLEAKLDGHSELVIDDGFSLHTYSLPGVQSGVRAVDWNGDGILDLVTVNHTAQALEVRYQDGPRTLTFSSMTSYPLTVIPLGHLWSDGAPFVVLPSSGSHRAVVVRGSTPADHVALQVIRNESPTIGEVYDVQVNEESYTKGLAAGDVDADGTTDLVLAEGSGMSDETYLLVLRGLTSGPDQFERNADFVFPQTSINDVVLADVTGDGRNDLLVATLHSIITRPERFNGAPPVQATDAGGQFLKLRAFPVAGTTTDVQNPGSRPVAGSLALLIAPNPSRGGNGRLSFTLPSSARVTADLFDLSGRRVRRILDESRDAGAHEEGFALSDASGKALGAGVYFVKLQAGAASGQRTIVVVH